MIVDGVKVEFGLVEDETIATDTITATATNEDEFSSVINTVAKNEKQKIAYLEPNYWLLDGSFVMPTDDDIAGVGEIVNLAPDPSFEGDDWEITTYTPQEQITNFSITKSTEHVVSGNYSKKISISDEYHEGSSGHYITMRASVYQNFTYQQDHKYYMRCFFYSEGRAYYEDWIYYKINDEEGTYGRNKQGIRYVSRIVEYRSGYTVPRIIKIGLEVKWRNSGGFNYTVWYDDLLVVDLTEKYGKGNEPSIAVCDRIFNAQKDIDIGYESKQLNEPQTLTYKFNKKHDSYGITLKFVPTSIPTDFTISYYNGDSLIGETRNVIGNKLETYINEDTRLQWDKVVLTIKKTQSGQRTRLQNIIFGVNDQYAEDELISIEANRTFSPTAEYADSGEVSFSFFNDGRYAIQTIKDLSQNVIDKLKMQVFVRKRGENEYTPFCVYYAESGKVEEHGRVIELTGHDGLYKLDDVMFTAGKVYPKGRSLADWAREVAQVADVQIEISDAFESIMSNGYIAEVPCREAFRLIAEAGHGIFGVDENDVIHIWSYDDIIVDANAISDDNIVDKSFSLENSNKYLGIKVIQYTFTKRSEEEELARVENLLVNSEPQTIELDFSSYPVDPDTIRIDATGGNPNIIEKTNSRVKFTIDRNEAMEVLIQVYGVAYDVAMTTIERGATKKNVKEISDNYLIVGELGDAVADYQYEHATNKYNYDAEILTTEDLKLGEVREMQGQNVVITDVGFSISYGDQSETIKGVDK